MSSSSTTVEDIFDEPQLTPTATVFLGIAALAVLALCILAYGNASYDPTKMLRRAHVLERAHRSLTEPKTKNQKSSMLFAFPTSV